MRHAGFTLIELLTTLAILAVLASMVAPVVQVQHQRTREHQLRAALLEIRGGIDAYKRAVDEGRVQVEQGRTGYPPSLDVLAQGVVDQRDPKRRKIFFLRRVPRDPFHSDPSVADADTWVKRAYASDASEPRDGEDVFDVRTGSSLTGLNGAPLARW